MLPICKIEIIVSYERIHSMADMRKRANRSSRVLKEFKF